MVRWLRVALVLLTGICAGAWRPPPQPLLLTTLHRTRREAPDNTRHLHLLGWHLELQENTAIRSPYYNECQFYTGRVLYEEKSSATVTECGDQLYGLLQVDGEEFVLQPTGNENNDGAHVLRRRDVLLSEQPAAYNLTGDTVSDLELDLSDEEPPAPVPQLRLRHSHDHHVEEYRNVMTVSRPVTGVEELWLEMAIVADHTMMKFHGQDETRVRHYILALMNIVSAIFNDPSVNSNMTLVINQLYLENDPVVKYGNVKKTLEAVNKWNYRHLMKLPPDRAGWDAAAWLTREPLGGPSGFAPVSGVCSRERSAAIIRDEGLTSAFVIAHELAHLLGLTHDGDNQCAAAAHRGSVMAPTVLASLHNFSWSSCSKKQLHDKAKKWWCLHTRSQDDGVELGGARELPKYAFTMDEQCRTEFGDGFSVCKSVKVRSACRRLWCAHRAQPNVCRSKRGAPLDGTPCGPGQWCVDRVCEPMPGHGARTEDREEQPERPHWDEWGPWSVCNADCGYGLRMRSRRCWYKGEVSESACEGGASQVATCWAGSTCAAVRDARSDWCRRRRGSLIPHIHPDESQQCEMWCVDYTGGEPSSYGSLPDATPCSYDRPYDLCYQGACVKGQCNPSDSSCNWCPDGYCSNNTHLYHRQLGKGWTRITMVPHEATQLSIYIATPIPLSIAIRERKRDKHILELRKHSKRVELEQQHNYLKYDPNVPQNLQIIDLDSNVIDIKEERFGWEGQVVAASSLLRWTQTDNDVHISAKSPLQTDLMIMAIPEHELQTEEPVTVEVSVNYSSPAGRSRPMEYRYNRWPVRGPCSASCGGGVRVVRPRCLRGQQCAAPRYEPCNTHRCEFRWSADEWESCSATCGDSGLQERQLFCVPVNLNSTTRRDLIRAMVSPALCSEPRPEQQQPCNRLPCPVYWQEMPWTPCSTTCGRGISRRPLACPAEQEFLCGARPRERRRRCRLRRCPAPRPAPCTADTLKYCELFPPEQLRRNCILPQFRKVCCNACAVADRTIQDVG